MNPLLNLALSMQSNPGVYALLLGSGVSRSAKIPTGWEVVLDLIDRLAAMTDGDVAGDPSRWYAEEFGEEPDYSKLLERLAKKRDERQRLLRSYFEPTEEEHEEGLKQPTAAHHAIANLCRRGYIKVIVTTNFDRLIEQALSAEGLQPTVVSTADAVKGAPPLSHVDLLLVKVHGDYRDRRIRNTTGELEEYEPAFSELLDRIFDEFGLVVSGWSGRWDPAMRAALERCRNQRYTTYWTHLEEPDESLERLLRLRRAELTPIQDADAFFTDLDEKVLALEEYARPHPLSVETAVATLKRYLPEPRHQVRYHDLLEGETHRVVEEMRGDRFSPRGSPGKEVAAALIQDYEAISEILRALVATASFWAEGRHLGALRRVVEDLGTQPQASGNSFLLDLRRYPALLQVYAGGIAAVANERWATLRALLLESSIVSYNSADSAAIALVKWNVLKDKQARVLPGSERRNRYTALSDWLGPLLRGALRPVIGSDLRYRSAFDRFEYLWGLIYADLVGRSLGDGRLAGPVGSFAWRAGRQARPIDVVVAEEIEREGESWPLLQAGFFGGDVERLKNKKTAFDRFWHRLGLGF